MSVITTTITLNQDIKNQATKKAKQDDLSFSAVIKILLRDYVHGYITIGTRSSRITENGFTENQETEIMIASKEARKGINTNSYDSVDDFLASLDK